MQKSTKLLGEAGTKLRLGRRCRRSEGPARSKAVLTSRGGVQLQHAGNTIASRSCVMREAALRHSWKSGRAEMGSHPRRPACAEERSTCNSQLGVGVKVLVKKVQLGIRVLKEGTLWRQVFNPKHYATQLPFALSKLFCGWRDPYTTL